MVCCLPSVQRLGGESLARRCDEERQVYGEVSGEVFLELSVPFDELVDENCPKSLP